MSFSSTSSIGGTSRALRVRPETPPAAESPVAASNADEAPIALPPRPVRQSITDDVVADLVKREPWPSDITTFAKMRELKNEAAHISLFGVRIPVRYSSSTVVAGSTLPSVSRMAVAHFTSSGLSYGSAIATNMVNMLVSLVGVTGTPDAAGFDERTLRNAVDAELKVDAADAIDEETHRLALNDKAAGSGDLVRSYGRLRGESRDFVRLTGRDGSVPRRLLAAMRDPATETGSRGAAPTHPTRELYSVEQLIDQGKLPSGVRPPLAEPETMVADAIAKLRHPYLESELSTIEGMLVRVDGVNQRLAMPLDRAIYEAADKSSGGELSRRLPRPRVAAPEIVVDAPEVAAAPVRSRPVGGATAMQMLRDFAR